MDGERAYYAIGWPETAMSQAEEIVRIFAEEHQELEGVLEVWLAGGELHIAGDPEAVEELVGTCVQGLTRMGYRMISPGNLVAEA